MLKVQKPTNTKPRPERFDFKFSNFQAIQVPKGWDRLFVSLIHVETGKTMAKLGKTLVRNGGCQWTETLSESIYITRHDSSKGYQDCLLKLIVSTGSTRSTTLGEVNINLANYASSRLSVAVSQPLKKCSYGTILQLKIHCPTPRSKTGDEEWKDSYSQEKDRNAQYHDVDTKSHRSDNSSDSKETSHESASGTIQSFDSLEGSTGKQNLREDYRNQEEEVNIRAIGSSKHLLEAAEDTIDHELRAEAKMWERNARKLMMDLDLSRNEFYDLSKKQSELVVELSAAHAEHDGLKREVEKLKRELEKVTKNRCTQDPVVQSENLVQIQKVLEDEMKYQQDLNDNIGLQLKRSQESNIELVSVLQELEETIEQQRTEIENLSSLKKLEYDVTLLEEALRDKTDELENEGKSNREILLQVEKDYEYKISAKEEEIASLEATLSGYVKGEHFEALDDNNENNEDLIKEIESLREKIQELEKDCAELTEENIELLFKLKDSNKITDMRKCTSFDSMSSENPTVCPSDESEVSDPKLKISTNTDLERNLQVLESEKNELENALSGLQEENVQLHESISGLKSKILKEADNFKSVATSLQDEIQILKDEMDIKTLHLKKQLLGAQEECEYLKEEKTTLQASAENFAQEIMKLRNLNSVNENELNASLQDLTDQLAACKQNHEKLMADHEKVVKLLANYKRSEEKLKTDFNGLELKHTISDYERQQLTKETGILKVQLQNILSLHQDEISILKSELNGCKFDKEKLELALQTVSSDFEELMKAENISLSEFEECKRNKLLLEEKLLQMETAKEIICITNEDLKNELSEIKMCRLEEDNIECLKKARSLEEEVNFLKERTNIHKEGANNHDFHDQSPLAVSMNHNQNKVLHESCYPARQKNNDDIISSKKPSINGDQVDVARERYGRTKASLETELRDLRERYLEMSLKYAEVEVEREDLVMKLKATSKGGKSRWFS